MLGPGWTRVKAIACVAAAMMAGCAWNGSAARLRTHAEVMVAIARKAVDLVGAGRFTAESMPELTYPLERATALARQLRARRSPDVPPSLVAFDGLVERYRMLIDAVDRTRRERRGTDAIAVLAVPLRQVEEAAAEVEAALRREESGRRSGRPSDQNPRLAAWAARCAARSSSA